MSAPIYRRIAVPLDSTRAGRQAISWAATLARKAGCPIDLVHVASPPYVGTELYGSGAFRTDQLEAIQRAERSDLDALAAETTSAGVTARPVYLTGDVPETLTEHVRGSDVDLVVMTTHDPGRVERMLLGSVTEALIRQVHVPVLLVRHDAAEPPIRVERTIQKMLIPLDGSEFGDEILPHARALASLLGTEIVLLGVLQPILAIAALTSDLGGPDAVVTPMNMRDENPDAEQTRAETEVLEQRAGSLRAAGLTVQTVVLVDGQTARAVVEYAKAHGVDAIAMTTHGRGALKRLVAGGVAQRVLRTSHLPMLMYRPVGR